MAEPDAASLPQLPPLPGLEFHHVGIGVRDMDAALRTYAAIGHPLLLQVDDPGLNIRVAFIASPPRGPFIELLAPLAEGGPLDALMRRKVLPSPYHTCYAVDDLDAGGAALIGRDFMCVAQPTQALAFDGARVAFFYHLDIGLIELVERPPARLRPGSAWSMGGAPD
jgi:methylmalonyl-CoA/ethylmalonyl-CoA epimerase